MIEPHTLPRRLCSEAFGTLCLVFAGTGAVVVNQMTDGAVTHVGVSLTFGLVVMALIYSLGNVSGCHLNPAVTLGLWAAGRLQWSMVWPSIGSQCVGAIPASGTLRLLFPESSTLGATAPAGSAFQSLALELVLPLILMFVILSMDASSSTQRMLAGIVVDGVIGLEWPSPSPESTAETGYVPPVRAPARPVALTWQIPDPRDMSADEFRGVRDLIEQKVLDLRSSLDKPH